MPSSIRIDPKVFLSLAVAVLLVPIKLQVAWLAAALFHELCHLIMLRILKLRICEVHVGCSGASISTEPLLPYQEMLCAIAGPIGSFSLLLFRRMMPLVAICGCVQGAYNLLPLYPMDGGRVAGIVLLRLLPGKWSFYIGQILRCAVYIVLVCCAIYLLSLSTSPVPLLLVGAVIWKDRKNSLQNRS